MKISYNTSKWILIILLLLETASATFLNFNFPQYILAWSFLYFFSGILISLFPIFNYTSDAKGNAVDKRRKAKQITILISFLVIIFYCFPFIATILGNNKIDYHNSDIIPDIKVLCDRWITGKTIYKPILQIWDGEQPGYFPFMWGPFIPFELLNIDVRWTTVVFYFVGLGLILWMLYRAPNLNWMGLIIILILVGNMAFIQLNLNWVFFSMTEEGVVVGYYLLLGYALTKNNPWLIGFAITCCLLSRYGLIFWIPSYFIFQFITGEKRRSIIEATVVLVLTCVLFIFPYFLKDPMYFLSIPAKYSIGTHMTWVRNYEAVQQSLGMAKLFPVSQYYVFARLTIILAGAVPLLFYTVLYIFRRSRKLNLAFAGLAGLKLTLTFFYNFIDSPFFLYLFIVPTLFSFILVVHFLNPESQKIVNESP
jgi:hypothetical protein